MQKLSILLAKADRKRLEELAGEDAVKLLRAFTGPMPEAALAALIVNRLGVQDALKNNEIRNLAFEKLSDEEAKTICDLVLQEDTGTPTFTLRQANFQRNSIYMARLLAHFGEGQDPVTEALVEKSNHSAPHTTLNEQQRDVVSKLRQSLSDPRTNILLHLPFGCGKQFAVMHAVIDLLRSSEDGQAILWLAEENTSCEDVYQAMWALWEKVGTRELTFCRAYGSYDISNFPNLRNSVIVSEARRFATVADLGQLKQLAPDIRAVVIEDGISIVETELGKILSDLQAAGAGNLVGISATPASLLRAAGLESVTREKFSRVVSSPEFSICATRWQAPRYNENMELAVIQVDRTSPIAVPADVVSAAFIEELASDFERNKALIDLIQSEINAGRGVAYYATSEDQARTFVGVLSAKGIKAAFLSSSMSVERRERQMSRFTAQPDAMVICVYDVSISGGDSGKLATAVMAAPTASFSRVGRVVGRFLSFSEDHAPAKLIFIDDGFLPFKLAADHLKIWDNLESIDHV